MLRRVFSANFLSLGFISRIARRRRFTAAVKLPMRLFDLPSQKLT
jgi:hypothetical protein